MRFTAEGGAIKTGAVVAASSIRAGAGTDVFAIGGAATAPASFNAGGDKGDGVDRNVDTEVEVEVGGGGAGAGALVGAIAIFGATTAGTSAGSWIWPSLIWETMFARARGKRASKRWAFVGKRILAVYVMLLRCHSAGVRLMKCSSMFKEWTASSGQSTGKRKVRNSRGRDTDALFDCCRPCERMQCPLLRIRNVIFIPHRVCHQPIKLVSFSRFQIRDTLR